jgi:hypothetical protein
MGRSFIYNDFRFEGSDINYISQGMAWAQFTHGNRVGLAGAMGSNTVYNLASIVVKPFLGTSSLVSTQRDLAQATYTGHKFSQLGFSYYRKNTQ